MLSAAKSLGRLGTIALALSQMGATGRATPAPFAISADSDTVQTLPTYAPQMTSAGVACVRGLDTWDDIEPTQGTWNWTKVDSEIATANANNLQISGIFFYGVNWIPTASGFPTTNITAWQTYVSNLVTHVNGKIKYWEVWNEPPNFTNNVGTPTDYAAIVNSAYTSAHAADPTCSVGLCAASNNVNWLYQSINAGAADHFDYIALHPYEMLGTIDNGMEAEYMSIVPTVRKMLADRDPTRANVPILFTELGESIGGTNGTTTVTATSQAQDLVKAYSMGLAQGAAHIDWFEGKDGNSGPLGLLDGQGNPRPALTAMTQLKVFLGAAPTYLGWLQLNNQDYGFVFQGATTTVMALWAPPGVTDNLSFAQAVQIVDPLSGNSTTGTSYPLTNSPVLIVGVPRTMVAQAKVDSSMPFRWGGDYTSASSITCTAGSPNTETGLHQLYADATSTAVTVYGGPARDCSKASGQNFTVDPNFLSYSTMPVTITAVVRGDAAHDTAGFNLQYESTTGMKNTGNYTSVPDNSKWYTVSWTITDPQFVGKWGYNFSLNSDSTTYSKYYLQSVTVSVTRPAVAPSTTTDIPVMPRWTAGVFAVLLFLVGTSALSGVSRTAQS